MKYWIARSVIRKKSHQYGSYTVYIFQMRPPEWLAFLNVAISKYNEIL